MLEKEGKAEGGRTFTVTVEVDPHTRDRLLACAFLARQGIEETILEAIDALLEAKRESIERAFEFREQEQGGKKT